MAFHIGDRGHPGGTGSDGSGRPSSSRATSVYPVYTLRQ